MLLPPRDPQNLTESKYVIQSNLSTAISKEIPSFVDKPDGNIRTISIENPPSEMVSSFPIFPVLSDSIPTTG